MSRHQFLILWLIVALSFYSPGGSAQQAYTLQQCLEYAVENNRNLKQSQYDREKAAWARQEILGSLLPQINGSANLNDNLKKARIIMPNFLNNMLPPGAQDPDADKYITVEMGTAFNASVGVSLSQQVLNFSLFNTLEIARTAEKMAELGYESSEEDVIYQTANLYFAIQSTEYAVSGIERSIELVRAMLVTMEVNYANGLARKTDIDRLRVNLVNLTTQRNSVQNAAGIQKNLLKLQMGFDVEHPILLEAIREDHLEAVFDEEPAPFAPENLTPYRLLSEKMNMVKLQKKSALYESLPTLSLVLNYQYNGVSDSFFSGETNYWYPTSVVGLNLRIPVFGGFARRARINQNSIEIYKTREDTQILDQSLNMAYLNARMKLGDALGTIELQASNQELAEEVFRVAEKNYELGLSSMSDILNASQALVQAQMSYAIALSEYMQAYVDLKKATGNIRSLIIENQ